MAGYGSDVGLTAYAAAKGITLAGTVAPAALRERGSAYVDGTYGRRFPGAPAGGIDQDRAWPRADAEDRYGNAIAGVPARIVNASYEAAIIEDAAPGALSAITSSASRVTSERVGPIAVTYADPVSGADIIVDATPMSTIIAGLLEPLLTPVLPGIFAV